MLRGSGRWRGQILAELLQGEGAVADGVFHGVTQFGERLVKSIGNEQGIIAKAAGTGRLQADMAGTDALKESGFRTGKGRVGLHRDVTRFQPGRAPDKSGLPAVKLKQTRLAAESADLSAALPPVTDVSFRIT